MPDDYHRIHCPNCQKRLRIRSEYVGCVVKCARCSHSLVATGPGPADATPESSERPVDLQAVPDQPEKKNERYSDLLKQLWEVNGRYQFARGQYRDLRTHFDRMTVQRQQDDERLNALEATRSELTSQLQAARDLVERGQQERDMLQEAVVQHVEELAQARERLDNPQRENDEAHAGLTRRDAELELVREQLARKVEEIAASQEMLAQREGELAEAGRLLSVGDDNLAAERARQAHHDEARAQDLSRLEGLERELAAVRNELAERDSELASLHQRLSLLDPEQVENREPLIRLEEELARSHRQLVGKDEELDAANILLHTRAEELSTIRAERDRLEAERLALTIALESSRQTPPGTESASPPTQSASQAEIEALVRVIGVERGRWESERAAWKERWEEERAEYSRQAELRVREAKEQAENEVESWRKRVDKLTRHFDGEREALRKAADQFSQEIIALRQERDATHTLMNSLTQERERITAYRDQIQAAFQQGERALQEKLSGTLQRLKQVAQEKEIAVRRGDEMSGQIRELRAHIERLGREGTESTRSLRAAPQSAASARTSAVSAPAGTQPGQRKPTPKRPGPAAGAGPDAETPLSIDHRDIALSELGLELETLGMKDVNASKTSMWATGSGTCH